MLNLDSTGKPAKVGLICMAILALISQSRQPVLAKDPPTITIYPSIIELEMKPGETATEGITVRNDSDIALPINIEVSNYTPVLESGQIDEKSIDSWDAREWVDTDQINIILLPKEARTVNINIAPPNETIPSSYFATILFKAVLPDDYFDAQSAHIIPYIGGIVAINIIEQRGFDAPGEVEIDNFESENIVYNEPLNLKTTLSNAGAYYNRLSGAVNISNSFSSYKNQLQVDQLTLFPGHTAQESLQYRGTLPPGRYSASLILTDGDTTYTMMDNFWVYPTLSVSLISLFTATATLLLFIKRKNLVKTLKILIGTEFTS